MNSLASELISESWYSARLWWQANWKAKALYMGFYTHTHVLNPSFLYLTILVILKNN